MVVGWQIYTEREFLAMGLNNHESCGIISRFIDLFNVCLGSFRICLADYRSVFTLEIISVVVIATR